MQILIGGVDKTSLFRVNSLEISDEINARSTCRFQLVDTTGLYHPNNGAAVEIYDNDANLIFGGFVNEPNENVLWGTDALVVNVDCVDNQAIADWRLVAESYDNMTTGDIVKDIIDTTLSEEGVWYNPSALSFDGVDDYVSLPNDIVTTANIRLNGITYEAYFTPKTYEPMRIVGQQPTSNYSDYASGGIGMTPNGNAIMVCYDDGIAYKLVVGTTTLQLNTAYKISGTYTPADKKIRLYVNGVEEGTPIDIITFSRLTDNMANAVGYHPQATALMYTNGIIDDVRIWNVARTQAEIQANMNIELIGNETGLAGYWKFNEGTGLTALDSTVNTNNGTINGATYTTDVKGGQSIQDGITATRVVFPRIKAATAIDDLAEMSGYTWWIDSNKRLYYVDRATYLAPWNITATSPIRNVQYRRNEDQYRNRQYIRAGHDTTDPQVATFKGDGEVQTFTVAFAIATVPTVTVNEASKTVGIRGLDTGKDWYWSKNEKEISQDNAGTKLISTDTLSVAYVGLFPILTVSEDASAITARKAVSGGTGIREEIEQQSSIDSADAALEIAQGKLIKYARIAGELVFETDDIGLEVGQIITVTFPAHAIAGVEFLIDRITVSEPFADQSLRYFVHGVDGQALGNWITFFKALAKQATTFSIRENEVLIKLKTTNEIVTVAESLSYIAAVPESRVGFATVGFSQPG